MKNRFRKSALLSIIALSLAFFLGGCSREKEISGQIFIVTKGRENVKLGLVGVHVLSDEQLKTAALKALEGRAESSTVPLATRLFIYLPSPVVKSDADGQFTLRVKGKAWLLAQAERKAGSSDETYLWAVSTEGQTGKLLLSNDNLLDDPTDLLTFLESVPGVPEALAKAEAEAEAAAKTAAKAATEKRLAWTGGAMRRAGFKEDQITRTLTLGGRVVAWGAGKINTGKDPEYGQSIVPAGLSGVVAIAAGGFHTVALKSDGTVVVWGNNDRWQSTVPGDLSEVTAITAGYQHTVALKSDGTVVAWGRNDDGQSIAPAGLSGVTTIAAGWWHTVALKSDGTVVTWGDNDRWQSSVPAGLSNVAAIAAGGFHTVALKGDGTVVAWGDNGKGQSTAPAGLRGVTAIAAGEAHTVALKNDGTVVAWGYNNDGQSTVPAGLNGVTAIAAGRYHTVALKSNGAVVAWGGNNSGQTTIPVGLSGVTAIAAGAFHTVALRLD